MRRALERALVVAVVALAVPSASIARPAQGESEAAPTFERDRSWPKPLPDNWRLGIVWAVSFDSRDHVWVLHAAEQYLVDIGDGYLNKRVIVFDGDSGEYVRHWGRYGEPPDDAFEAGERSPRYAHAAQLSNDGLLYVSDREHGSIHVHRRQRPLRSERGGAHRHTAAPRPAGARLIRERRSALLRRRFPGKHLNLRPLPAREIRRDPPAGAVGDSGHAYVMTLGASVDVPAGSEQPQISCRGPGVDETRRESAARGVCARSLASVRIRGC